MSNNDAGPPLSEYQIIEAGFEQVGTKYRGHLWISITGTANDPTYHRYFGDELHDTPEAAEQAIRESFRKTQVGLRDN